MKQVRTGSVLLEHAVFGYGDNNERQVEFYEEEETDSDKKEILPSTRVHCVRFECEKALFSRRDFEIPPYADNAF